MASSSLLILSCLSIPIRDDNDNGNDDDSHNSDDDVDDSGEVTYVQSYHQYKQY